jgi:hypothetical protein
MAGIREVMSIRFEPVVGRIPSPPPRRRKDRRNMQPGRSCSRIILRWILVFAAGSLLPAQESPPDERGQAPSRPRLLERVVAVGASLTHGFGSHLPPSQVLDEAIRVKHEPVLNVSHKLQFLAAPSLGEDQIDQCLDHRPTLVLAVDFLFWYGYGFAFRNKTELDRRMKTLRLGLEQLDRLRCPVVVGDLPDMRGASKRMLHPAQIPSPHVLEALNQELRAWADKKKNVLLIPLAAWVKTLKAGKWTVPGSPDGKHPETVLTVKVALQWDRLHPTRIGVIVLTERIIQAVKKRFGPAADGLAFDLWSAVEQELGKKGPRGRGAEGSGHKERTPGLERS